VPVKLPDADLAGFGFCLHVDRTQRIWAHSAPPNERSLQKRKRLTNIVLPGAKVPMEHRPIDPRSMSCKLRFLLDASVQVVGRPLLILIRCGRSY
jgi:hypothetical protein